MDIGSVISSNRTAYVKTLQTIHNEGFCPFCEEHFAKHHHEPILFKNKYWLVTKNAWPYEGSRYHFLFVSRKHIISATEMSPAAWNSMALAYKRLAKEFNLSGSTLIMRSGDTQITGASVQHLHAQIIIGRKRKNDSKKIEATVGYY